MVGNVVINMVNSTLTTGRVPRSILEAFITLILKKDNPENAGDIRLITLLNVVYKIISKVFVNKMRLLMEKLIGPFQNSFIPGRSTLDNVTLTQEVVHNINRKKSKKRGHDC